MQSLFLFYPIPLVTTRVVEPLIDERRNIKMVYLMCVRSVCVFLLTLNRIALLSSATEQSVSQNTLKQNSFEDFRCKCVCPKYVANNTETKRTVFIRDNMDPDSCKIQFVAPEIQENIQALCECKIEERNTATIKVVVIIVICIVSLLFGYMVFLICLDPLIARRPANYQQYSNEEDAPTFSRAQTLQRQKSIVNRVTDEQKKWKSTVQEQRRTIYDRHAMLN